MVCTTLPLPTRLVMEFVVRGVRGFGVFGLTVDSCLFDQIGQIGSGGRAVLFTQFGTSRFSHDIMVRNCQVLNTNSDAGGFIG